MGDEPELRGYQSDADGREERDSMGDLS